LEREGQELIKSVDVDGLQKGRHIYCTWAAHYMSPEYTQQHKVEQVADIYDKIRSQGFEGMICRSSNLKVVQILYPLGGELLKETEFVRGDKKFSLYFAMLHLQNEALG
jgi:tRNA-binding EMAP/Myf-like protein